MCFILMSIMGDTATLRQYSFSMMYMEVTFLRGTVREDPIYECALNMHQGEMGIFVSNIELEAN